MKDFSALCQGNIEGNVSTVIRKEAHLYNRMTKMEMVFKLLCKSGFLYRISVSLPAVSWPLKIVKGQLLPWKDKPGKTLNPSRSLSSIQALQQDIYINNQKNNILFSRGL